MTKIDLISRDFVTIESIAKYCMVSRGTVSRWIKSRKLNAIKLPSGQYRITFDDFRVFLKRYNVPFENKSMQN